jgi:hypothetical protein
MTAGTSTDVFLENASDLRSDNSPDSESVKCTISEKGIIGSRMSGQTEGNAFYNHISPSGFISLLGRDLFDHSFKITNIRNPWDKCVSDFFWKTPREKISKLAFGSFLDMHQLAPVEVEITKEDFMMDAFNRFERLEFDLSSTLQSLGISQPIVLSNFKSEFRPKNHDYRDFYVPSTKKRVAHLYQYWISLGEFEF